MEVDNNIKIELEISEAVLLYELLGSCSERVVFNEMNLNDLHYELSADLCHELDKGLPEQEEFIPRQLPEMQTQGES